MVYPQVFLIRKDNIRWQVDIQGHELWFSYSTDEGQIWTEPKLVTLEYHDFITFAIAKEKMLKIVFLNLRGDIECCNILGTEVAKIFFDKKWLENEQLSYLSLQEKGEGKEHLILITCSPDGNLKRIRHSKMNNEGWECPKLIDYFVGEEELSLATVIEDDGTVFMTYSFKGELFYKEWHPLLNCWSEKTKPFFVEDSVEKVNLINDEKGIIYLIWISRTENNSRVKFKRRIKGGWPIGGWQKEKIIFEGDFCSNPVLLRKEAKVIGGWETAEGYYISLSMDEGLTFGLADKLVCNEDLVNLNSIFLDFSSGSSTNIASCIENYSANISSLLETKWKNKENEKSLAEKHKRIEEKVNDSNLLEELKNCIIAKEEELRKIKKRENELLQINKKLREKIKKYIKKNKEG